MNIGDIVTIVTVSGEYVGKLETATGQDVLTVSLTEPRMILQSPDGKMGFAKGIAVTGEENPKSVMFQNIVFMTPTNERVATAWQEATSNIVTPSKPSIVTS